MKELKRVTIEGAPGYGWFEGWEYDRFGAVDGRGELSIVIDYDNEIHVIPSKHVTYVTD